MRSKQQEESFVRSRLPNKLHDEVFVRTCDSLIAFNNASEVNSQESAFWTEDAS